jgi:FkbM family methyltransferase
VKKRIRKWLYGKCPGFRGSFPYYGIKVYFPINSHIFGLACEKNGYEHETVNLIRALIKPRSHFFDIGANIGLISIPILRSCYDCIVYSFEPSPNALPYLHQTAAESPFTDRWRIIGKAVGSEVGETMFSISSPERGAYDGIKDTKRVVSEKKIRVPLTTVDNEWERNGKPQVSVMKIDVEGAEISVLQGSIGCISSEKPYIITEWNGTNLIAYNCRFEELLEFAKKIKYRIFSMPHLNPIYDSIHLKMQMFRTENFLLVPEEQ